MPSHRPLDLTQLKRYAIARSLFRPTSLPQALAKLGFVQADPIRSPARAQDLILRHRVTNYKAGDLELRYPKLRVEEDFFVNYGFVTPRLQALMHPRTPQKPLTTQQSQRAAQILDFVRERGVVHPQEVQAYCAHGKARNWFGGHSNVSTQLLDEMHYRGLLRVAGRQSGTRLYALTQPKPAPENASLALSELIDGIAQLYAPLPAASLLQLLGLLMQGVPQFKALKRTAYHQSLQRLPSCQLDGVTWLWPRGEDPGAARWTSDESVRLLAPFDPVVWDRRRFELFWGWAYRFEAYTPPAKRIRGYYAMTLLWQGEVIGWGNISRCNDRMSVDLGYQSGTAPRERRFQTALNSELAQLAQFLALSY